MPPGRLGAAQEAKANKTNRSRSEILAIILYHALAFHFKKGKKDMARKTATRADGRQGTSFRYKGKRYYAYGRTKKEANEKARKMLQELENNTYKKTRDLTMDEYFERWINSKRGRVKESTLSVYRVEWKRASEIIIDAAGQRFGDLGLSEVEPENINELQRGLQQSKDRNGKMPNTSYVNLVVRRVRYMLNDAVKQRAITYNPAEAVSPLRRTKKEARETIHRALTIEETKRFFDAAEGSWYYNLFRFLLCSGCRIGEAGALMPSDIRGGHIYICRTLTRNEGNSVAIGDSPKTKKSKRTILLKRELAEAINEQREINRQIFGDKVIGIQEPIFKSAEGALLSDTSIIKEIDRIAEIAGIERFTPHAFRDTFATRAIESGMNPNTLKETLGHSSYSMTMDLYAHVMEETKDREMASVNFGI